jgi:hypothetical protein
MVQQGNEKRVFRGLIMSARSQISIYPLISGAWMDGEGERDLGFLVLSEQTRSFNALFFFLCRRSIPGGKTSTGRTHRSIPTTVIQPQFQASRCSLFRTASFILHAWGSVGRRHRTSSIWRGEQTSATRNEHTQWDFMLPADWSHSVSMATMRSRRVALPADRMSISPFPEDGDVNDRRCGPCRLNGAGDNARNGHHNALYDCFNAPPRSRGRLCMLAFPCVLRIPPHSMHQPKDLTPGPSDARLL